MKAAVVVLTAAVFVSSAASCYRTEAEETVIRESDPWYDITSVKINPGIDSTDFEYVNNDYVPKTSIFRLITIWIIPWTDSISMT